MVVKIVKKKNNKKKIFWWILGCFLVVVAVAIIINRGFIGDLFRAAIYAPSAEMEQIRDKLELTDDGVFLFNASQPVLSDRDSFNEKCSLVQDETTAVLGCYVNNDIYVYNVVQEELSGIREVTTAHELLHAVWSRLGNTEKDELQSQLNQIIKDYYDVIGDEINSYDNESRIEELYVRAGTEIKDLPQALEKHYGKWFKNQDKIVGYYDGYNKVFKDLTAEIERLENEMASLKTNYEAKISEYEGRMGNLSTQIDEFNKCAETAGCFNSQWAFNQRRAELVNEQNALNGLYDEINYLINEYNARVDKYNQDAIYHQKLNQIINSSIKVEENI